jgi:16S rRNA (guanine966-N2)-methyltransferase
VFQYSNIPTNFIQVISRLGNENLFGSGLSGLGFSELRIIGGEFKGRKLLSVRGAHTRPTADRTREAVFNILRSGVQGAIVLDLFAGTGALGLEALSRGAQSAFFIETNKNTRSILKRNIHACSVESQATVVQWNIVKNLNCIRSVDPAFNLVFMDPPYNKHLLEPTLSNLHDSCCLNANARGIIEHSPFEAVPAGLVPFELVDQRRYGKTLVSFLGYML